MTVYVDDARRPWRGWRMSHMWCGSTKALMSFADRLGLSRRWIQRRGRVHYDVSDAYREKAIRAGAIPVSTREMLSLMLGKSLEEIRK